MDLVQPTQQAPATDDQELAKVLESMNANAGAAVVPATDEDSKTETASDADATGLQFEETAATDDTTSVTTDEPTLPPVPPVPVVDPLEFDPPSIDMAEATPIADAPVLTSSEGEELDSIKKDALAELRPLVDKLELPAEEKFDTLLLIIRSTDDKTLVSAAHEAAKSIEDETRRAQALLDVIKEIDFFSNPQK